MSNNFKHTRTWRDLLDEIPSIQWQKIAREPKPDTEYLIFKKLNKTLPLHRGNLEFKQILPNNPRQPLERGKVICIAVNSHPKPLELNYSVEGGSADNNVKTTIKLTIDYRVDDAIKLITEFDDALSDIEEYYDEALKTIFDNQAELSSAALKNEILALEVSQFGIFIEKVSVSNALEPESVEEQQSISDKERIAELEMALYTEEQTCLEQKQRIAELENALKAKSEERLEQSVVPNKKEEWLSLKKAKFLLSQKEDALKAQEESLAEKAEHLAKLEKRLQFKQSNHNQSRERSFAPEPPLLNNPEEKEPNTFSPIVVDREVEMHDFEPIDYYEDDNKYEEIKKTSIIKKVIFILMVIISIGAVVFYLPAIVTLIKSLMGY